MGPTLAVAEARLDAPAHSNLAGETFNRANELAGRSKAAQRQRHGVGDADRAAARPVGGLEQVAVFQVLALGGEGLDRFEAKSTAALRVEDRSEDAARIQIWKAEPVDGSFGGHQGRGSSIADQGVVANRGIAVSPSCGGGRGDGLAPCYSRPGPSATTSARRLS